MKPKPADKNDPAVRAHDILMGLREKPDNGRVALVMSLVYLFEKISTIERADQYKDLSDCFAKVMQELNLTEKELNLYYFEARKSGI